MADKSVAQNGHATLVASTVYIFEITGPGHRVELVHHGDVTNPTFFFVGQADGATPTTGAGEEGVVLPGERLTVNMPQGVPGATNPARYVAMISAGTPSMSVISLPEGR